MNPNDSWMVGDTITIENQSLTVEAAYADHDRNIRIHSLTNPQGERFRYVPGLGLRQMEKHANV